MAYSFRNCSMGRLLNIVCLTLVAIVLAGCGGSSNRDQLNNVPPATVSTLTLSLLDTNGAASNSLTLSGPLIAQASVRDASGNPAANIIVTFATGGALSVLSPSSGQTLTNASGVATVNLYVKDFATAQAQAGTADTLTATAMLGTAALAASKPFQLGKSPVGASLVFVSASPADQSIVIQGSGGTGRSDTALLTFRALDSFGQPLASQIINFALSPDAKVSLQTASAVTGLDGTAIAIVRSGFLASTFRVLASFASQPSISTISGTMTVTTGQAVQSAFSLSETFFNIEGWSHDNITNTINILMADAVGNPVADGTPVVFQTDSGAVGSSSNGGCSTVNGACSVSYRSQNPRYALGNTAGKRAGLATITASSSTSQTTLQGQIGMFLSGSDAVNVFLAGTSTQVSASSLNVLTTTNCLSYTLKLELNDVNFNPLPFGTTITSGVDGADLTIGTVTPNSVPNVYPHDDAGSAALTVANMATRQGSVHAIPIAIVAATTSPPVPPDVGCYAGGGRTATGTFKVTIASPLGTSTVYAFGLTYPIQ